MRKLILTAAVTLALAACQRKAAEPPPAAEATPATPAPALAADLPAVEPPAPGTPGGLPADRTPVTEGPFTLQSAQGAADVVQTYFAHLGQKDYAAAWPLWSDGGRASGLTLEAFARSFEAYSQYNAQVGGPSAIEGAAGSLYVTVPVVIYGRRVTGEELHQSGTATLRRVNDVPGATAEQRAWRIAKIELKPSPGDGRR